MVLENMQLKVGRFKIETAGNQEKTFVFSMAVFPYYSHKTFAASDSSVCTILHITYTKNLVTGNYF